MEPLNTGFLGRGERSVACKALGGWFQLSNTVVEMDWMVGIG